MPEYRGDTGERPGDKFGVPGIRYPTPNTADLVIVEDLPIRRENYEALPYGGTHPEHASALLVWQGPIQGNEQDIVVRRIYANRRTGQDAYNYALKFLGESVAHKVYIRSYLKLRSEFTPAPKGLALRGPLTGVVLDFAGENVVGPVTVVVTDAHGVGAQFATTIGPGGIGNEITSLTLVNGGDHYEATGNVTVTVTPAGFSAQPLAHAIGTEQADINALLTHEEHEPAEAEFASLFVRVTRVYKTLPGPVITSRRWGSGGNQILHTEQDVLAGQVLAATANMLLERIDGETSVEAKLIRETMVDAGGNPVAEGLVEHTIELRDTENQVTISTTFRIVAANFVLPIEGTAYKTGYVIGARKVAIEGSPKMIAEVTWCPIPPPRIEFPSLSWQFPGIFTLINPNWYNDLESPGALPRPWVGIDYEHIEPRTKKITGRLIYHFTLGPTTFLPVIYRVTTPGTGSKTYKMIRENTVHPDLDMQVTDLNTGVTVIVEKVPRSTPSTYDDYDILIADADAKVWRGRIYVRTILQISESLNAQNFPSMYFPVPFFAEGGDIINRMADLGYPDTGTKLTFYSNNAGDTQQAGVQGKVVPTNLGGNPEVGLEAVTLAGLTRVRTTQDWWKVHEIKLTSPAIGTIFVLGASLPNTGSITFVGIPAVGDTFTITRNGVSRVFTFRKPEQTKFVLDDKSSLNIGAVPADYLKIYGQDGEHYFWFNTDNLVTPPATPPGVAHEVDIADVSIVTAEQILPILKSTIESVGKWFVHQSLPDEIQIIDKFLGTRVDASLSAGIPAPWAVTIIEQGTVLGGVRTLPAPPGATTNDINSIGLALLLTNDQAQVDQAMLDGYASAGFLALTFSANGSHIAPDTVEVSSDEYFEPGAETWVLANTGTAFTLDQVDGGEDGPEVTRILPGNSHAYRDVDFWNPTLTDNNLPAGVNVTTNAIATGNRPILLTYRAHGKPAIPVQYDVSDNGTVWFAGAQNGTMKKAGREVIRTITPELTYFSGTLKNVNFIRLRVDNTVSARVRQMHAAVLINYTD